MDGIAAAPSREPARMAVHTIVEAAEVSLVACSAGAASVAAAAAEAEDAAAEDARGGGARRPASHRGGHASAARALSPPTDAPRPVTDDGGTS
ncbi:hypothetical protein JKP88DRAFT_288786 [Tribonema minus]|uniref:Uncharacterized protein n=1 Tax=Tribonema minus TaxID=303371 RepID=A0A835Z2F7_9STRA|nr:hypothetical protein JKP88DRAFT_288786 [Tribonema minus]